MIRIRDVLADEIKGDMELIVDILYFADKILETPNIIEVDERYVHLDQLPEEFLIRLDAILGIQFHYEEKAPK